MRKLLSFFLLVALISTACHYPAPRAPQGSKPVVKNIILMIGDGMGFNQLYAADMVDTGTTGTAVCEQFPYRYSMSTWSIGAGYDPVATWPHFADLVGKIPHTDSAAAATAMATGHKTYDAAIGMIGASAACAVKGKNITEYAEERGMATGVVTSVEWSHATPAGFVAHNAHRDHYDQIAREMLTESKVDVIMGCGHPFFKDDGQTTATPHNYQFVGGQDTWDALTRGTLKVSDADGDGKPDPWTLIQTREDFQKLATIPAPPRRVCGTAQVRSTLQETRVGDPNAAPGAVPLIPSVPSLSEMSLGALNVLSSNQRGFFLMIEGGAIDWACHANRKGRLIEEALEFRQAMRAVSDWIDQNSNWDETLVIVVADHETGFLWGPVAGQFNPLVSNGAGRMPGMAFNSNTHTNQLVPFFAKGPKAAGKRIKARADQVDPCRGRYLDNTELGQLLIELAGGDYHY